MKQSKPRKSTIHKYTLYLTSLLIKIEKYHHTFDILEFRKKNQLPNNFVKYCEELGYISRISGKHFKALIDHKSVSEFHGRRIAEKSLRYNINHSYTYNNKYKHFVVGGDGCVPIKPSKSVIGLSQFSIDEIMDELKRRGYSGELTKVTKKSF